MSDLTQSFQKFQISNQLVPYDHVVIYIKPNCVTFSKKQHTPSNLESLSYGCHIYPNDETNKKNPIFAVTKTLKKRIKHPKHQARNKIEVFYVALSPDEEVIEQCLDEDDSQENGDGEGSNSVAAAFHYMLPHKSLVGLWESLEYNDVTLKDQLYSFVSTIQAFSSAQIDPNLVSLNKLILLHGLPGTGKTSLCRALANIITVDLVSVSSDSETTSLSEFSIQNHKLGEMSNTGKNKYKYGQLIEINCHSLFSKWFSESGKLVMKQFQNIRDLASDQECLVFVLIDEIESIASSRNNCTNSEPTDSIRVVNALLTQLDNLKLLPNVITLATSNLIEKIDAALLDRADLLIKIPLPGYMVHTDLLFKAYRELVKKNLVKEMEVTHENVKTISQKIKAKFAKLGQLAEKKKISGRSIKKIPFMACLSEQFPIESEHFLENLEYQIMDFSDREGGIQKNGENGFDLNDSSVRLAKASEFLNFDFNRATGLENFGHEDDSESD